MLNYHTDLVIRIDLVLLGAYLLFAAILILYIILRDYHLNKRARKLQEIKQRVAQIFLSGKDTGAAGLCNLSGPEQFIDVQTNRRKYTVFFNESEQQLFKECFMAANKVKTLEDSAKKTGNKWRRIEAIITLGYAQADETLGTLEKFIYSKDEDISYYSALAIGLVSTMRSVSILMNFLKKKPLVRRKIASILEKLTTDISSEVIKFADDPDPEVRTWAVRLLSSTVSQQHIKKIETLTEDPSPDVRSAACQSLAKLKDKDSKKALLKLLKDDIWFVRMHAVNALSELFAGETMPEIMRLLNDGSLLVLESVKSAMANNMAIALPHIQKVLEGRDDLAKSICREAMEISEAKKP